KSAFLMSSVLATNPPVLTCAPGANRMPLGLTKNTCPLEDRLPNICEAPPPVTLFKAADEALGWEKCTEAPEPISKLCQLAISFCVAWSMTMRLPLTTMLPFPASMAGPVGNTEGSSAQAAAGVIAIISARQAGCNVNLNEPLLCLCMPYPGLEAM